MKKYLFLFFSVVAGNLALAQSFSTAHDTVIMSASGSFSAGNNITNHTTSDITLQWRISETNFPADWMEMIGICDAWSCWGSGDVWPVRDRESVYAPGEGDFHLQGNMMFVSGTGPYYLKVQLTNKFTPAETLTQTYIVDKASAGVMQAARGTQDDAVVLFPNPATTSINVYYGSIPGVAAIGIYSIIGREMKKYMTSESSASLDIEQLPSGIYFVKLIDAHGYAVAAQKFTKQ